MVGGGVGVAPTPVPVVGRSVSPAVGSGVAVALVVGGSVGPLVGTWVGSEVDGPPSQAVMAINPATVTNIIANVNSLVILRLLLCTG